MASAAVPGQPLVEEAFPPLKHAGLNRVDLGQNRLSCNASEPRCAPSRAAPIGTMISGPSLSALFTRSATGATDRTSFEGGPPVGDFGPNDGDRLRWGDVAARREVRLLDIPEQLPHRLGRERDREATAHRSMPLRQAGRALGTVTARARPFVRHDRACEVIHLARA